jgi:hypothetical protein
MRNTITLNNTAGGSNIEGFHTQVLKGHISTPEALTTL